jgi:hypothetical protein
MSTFFLKIKVTVKRLLITVSGLVTFSCNSPGQFSNTPHLSSNSTLLESIASHMSQQPTKATFVIDFHGNGNTGDDGIKQGKFVYKDPEDKLSFETTASSGYQKAANDPVSQSFKNQGLIPSGTWTIELITEPKTDKEKELNRYPPIFKLTPQADVVLSSSQSNEDRGGFLIHSGKNPLTASRGCIILDKAYRDKLKVAVIKYGPIELTVSNRVY